MESMLPLEMDELEAVIAFQAANLRRDADVEETAVQPPHQLRHTPSRRRESLVIC